MEMEIQKWMRRKTKAKNEGNLEQLSNACNKLAELYFKHNSYEEALKEFKEEAVVHEAQANKIKLAVSNRMIGEVLGAMGNYKEALVHQFKHLELAKAEEDNIEIQRALATIGRTYFCQAESICDENDEYRTLLSNAKNAYIKSFTLCEEIKGIGKQEHCQMKARLLLNIGLVQECQHKNDKAIESIQKAIKLCKELDIFEDLFRCYSSLGMLYYRLKNTGKALSLLELALDVAGRLEEKAELSCETLLNKAEVLFSLPDFQRAKQELRKAYKLRTPIKADHQTIEKNLKISIAMCNAQESLLQIPDTDLIGKKKLYEKMGDGCVAVKNYNAALEYYHKMKDMAEMLNESGQELALVYVSLAQTYKDNGQHEQALEYFQKELELWKGNPSEACNTMLNIIEVMELTGNDLEHTYEEALQLARKARNTKLEIISLQGLVNAGHQHLSKDLEILQQAELSSSEDEEEASPDFAHDVCLDSSTDDEEYDRPTNSRKRPRQLKVRRNEKGETQLHVACINGNLALAKRLIEQGHPVNERDHCGWLPLHEASNHGYRDIVEFLLDNGANINDPGGIKCGGITPLHDAASCGHLSVVELLLERGATVASFTDEGDTPLDCLIKWKTRSKPKFDHVELTFFHDIESRLREILNKAGHGVSSNSQKQKDNSPLSGVLHRRMQGTRNRRRMLDDDDEEEENHIRNVSDSEGNVSDSTSSESSHTVDDISISRPISPCAAKEYENVMKMLRTKDKQIKEPVLISTENKDQRAFLEDEDVGDDWLEQDILISSRPRKKKRLTSPVERHRQEFMSGNCRVTGGLEVEDDDMIVSDDSTTQHNIVSVPHKNKSSGSMDDFIQQVPRITESTQQESIEITNESRYSDNSVDKLSHSIKICIEEKIFLVPVHKPQEYNIRWLKEEAVRRFTNVEGVHPTLKLLTEDGAFLSEDDPVSVLNSGNVRFDVISWDIPPITDRYLEACKLLNSDPNNQVLPCLEESQATQSLKLLNLWLMPDQVEPLFRALKRQNTLHTLVLAGNCIGDEGVKYLATGLKTLRKLKHLDLSCNNISSEGISFLIPELPTELSHFSLSHNPIGNSSLEFLLNLPPLESLKLVNCDFSSQCITSQSLNSLIELDVSCNSLGGTCIAEMLGQLNPSCIEVLNLRSTNSKQSSPVSQGVLAFFTREIHFPKLKVLDLSDCNLRDEDVQNLLNGLQNCPVLEMLKLECNRQLSSLSLRRLLQRKPVLKSLQLAGCCNIDNYLEDGSVERWISEGLESLTLNCRYENEKGICILWHNMWGNEASVLKYPAGLLSLSIKHVGI
ncbi:hypothetical protein L9F63_005975 [Diploptera punctata]|uniref:Tonsoku-like protein n=1 Tax=Diploptera punctata TaxID=6984 RepID=A0AAD7ZB84_DIPPU|nr:hypothetical protein L9F63_005975 [Diploptera punctata]